MTVHVLKVLELPCFRIWDEKLRICPCVHEDMISVSILLCMCIGVYKSACHV